MGNLYRWCIAGLLAFVFVTTARAETIPATSGPQTFEVRNQAPSGQTTAVQSSYQAACDAGLVLWQAKFPSSGFYLKSCQVSNPTAGENQLFGTAQYGYGTSGGYYTGQIVVKSVGFSCPSGQNWTLSGSSCVRPDCGAGYDRNAQGQCVKDCTAKAGQPTTNGTYSFGGSVSTWSVSECKVYCPQRVISAFGGTGYGCKYTGASADPDVESGKPEPPDPEKLPPEKPEDCLNRGSGYVTSSTGKITCVPSSDAPEGQKPSKKESDTVKESGPKNADGTIDKTSPEYKKEETSTSQGADGTTTTNKKETIAGTSDGNGNVTCPTGYTKNPDNTCSKTTTTQQSNLGFCEQNPNSPLCKESKESRFGGGCDSGFTCDGDAATCASARAAHELKCSFQPDSTTGLHDSENPGGTPGQAAKAAEALNADGNKDFNIAAEFSAKNQQWVNYSSACPVGVQQFSILGKTVEIDASIVCDIGLFIRLMVHIVAYLGLARVFATKLV